MVWQINHHFVGLACQRGVTLTLGPTRWSRPEPRPRQKCPVVGDLGIAQSIRDNITSVLAQRGIDYDPAGDGGSWLWCLGGPDLYRRPMAAEYEHYADADTCLDLNVWICEEHEIISAELFPYDIVPESGGSSSSDPRQSSPIVVGDDPRAVATEFLSRLETWLDEILDLGGA